MERNTRTRVAEFSPLMLVIGRESRRLSQTALAKAVGVTQGALSQMEAGIIRPTDEVLDSIAERLDYPVSLFRHPVRFTQVPATFFRKKTRIGARDVAAIRATVNLFRLRIEILLRSLDADLTPRVLLTDLAKEGKSPEDAAGLLRVYWNVAPGPVRDLTSVVESHGILVVAIDFGTAQVDGLSIYEPNDSLPPMVIMNPTQSTDRWRPTLAHDVAHIVLHHHLRNPAEGKDTEEEAFRFASEFLMSFRAVSGHLRYLNLHRMASLKKHWGLSMQAILMRSQRSGMISERHARRFWIELRRSDEPVELPSERPRALTKLVERHLGELNFTAKALSSALHQNVDQFRSDFGRAGHLRLA